MIVRAARGHKPRILTVGQFEIGDDRVMTRWPFALEFAPDDGRLSYGFSPDIANMVDGPKQVQPAVEVIGRPAHQHEIDARILDKAQGACAPSRIEIALDKHRLTRRDPRRDRSAANAIDSSRLDLLAKSVCRFTTRKSWPDPGIPPKTQRPGRIH